MMTIYKKLRALDPAFKPFVVIFACFIFSNLLRIVLPPAIAYGLGFSGSMLISYPILDESKWTFSQWLVISILIGLGVFSVQYIL
jgi:hypothetical protein